MRTITSSSVKNQIRGNFDSSTHAFRDFLLWEQNSASGRELLHSPVTRFDGKFQTWDGLENPPHNTDLAGASRKFLPTNEITVIQRRFIAGYLMNYRLTTFQENHWSHVSA
jgi:hypothetical protein